MGHTGCDVGAVSTWQEAQGSERTEDKLHVSRATGAGIIISWGVEVFWAKCKTNSIPIYHLTVKAIREGGGHCQWSETTVWMYKNWIMFRQNGVVPFFYDYSKDYRK